MAEKYMYPHELVAYNGITIFQYTAIKIAAALASRIQSSNNSASDIAERAIDIAVALTSDLKFIER